MSGGFQSLGGAGPSRNATAGYTWNIPMCQVAKEPPGIAASGAKWNVGMFQTAIECPMLPSIRPLGR
jgi:hypothetical protein